MRKKLIIFSLLAICIILAVIFIFEFYCQEGQCFEEKEKTIEEVREAEERTISSESKQIPTPEISPQPVACVNECSPKGIKMCSGNGYHECGNFDEDECSEWTFNQCPINYFCEDNQCVLIEITPVVAPTPVMPSVPVACVNECSSEGIKICTEQGYRECGYFDDDKCLEWTFNQCPINYFCEDNRCITNPAPAGYAGCEYPFCDSTPKIYNLIPSNDPRGYLSNSLPFLSASDFDYPPLRNKVNELVSGKTSDYDKLVAIATWVRNSRPYGFPSLANEHKSLTAVFNSGTGICLDSSLILTAMLRIAGIPVRSVGSTYVFHEFNEVYVNNKWIQVDATFIPNPPANQQIPPFIQNISIPNTEPAIFHEPWIQEYNIRDTLGNKNYTIFGSYKSMPIESDFIKSQGIAFGKVIFPVIAKPVYHDYYLVYPTNGTGREEPAFIVYRLDSLNNSCLINIRQRNFYGSGMTPNLLWWAFDENGRSWTGAFRATGYLVSKLPECKYRITYAYNHEGLNINDNGVYRLAYTDFEIGDDDVIKINPNSLIKYEGANQNNFDLLVNTLKEVPSYESLS